MRYLQVSLLLALLLAASLAVSVVDLTPLLVDPQSGEAAATAAAILSALSAEGLFIATVTGANPYNITTTDAASSLQRINTAREVFKFSEELKVKFSARFDNESFGRGFIPFGRESGMVDTFYEVKEGFSYGSFDTDPYDRSTNPLRSSNIFPGGDNDTNDSGFSISAIKQTLRTVYEEHSVVLGSIVRAVSHALGDDALPADCSSSDKESLMRLFHYFNADSDPKSPKLSTGGARIGSSPHTDWGLLTSILQDGTGGLQFLSDESQWVDVPAVPGQIVINAGDYLSLRTRASTRARVKSPVHRVVLKDTGEGGADRISFVLFYYPNYSSSLREVFGAAQDRACTSGVLHNTLTAGGEGGAESLFGDYIMSKWRGVLQRPSESGVHAAGDSNVNLYDV